MVRIFMSCRQTLKDLVLGGRMGNLDGRPAGVDTVVLEGVGAAAVTARRGDNRQANSSEITRCLPNFVLVRERGKPRCVADFQLLETSDHGSAARGVVSLLQQLEQQLLTEVIGKFLRLGNKPERLDCRQCLRQLFQGTQPGQDALLRDV